MPSKTNQKSTKESEEESDEEEMACEDAEEEEEEKEEKVEEKAFAFAKRKYTRCKHGPGCGHRFNGKTMPCCCRPLRGCD